MSRMQAPHGGSFVSVLDSRDAHPRREGASPARTVGECCCLEGHRIVAMDQIPSPSGAPEPEACT
jgi:hypothetical protein